MSLERVRAAGSFVSLPPVVAPIASPVSLWRTPSRGKHDRARIETYAAVDLRTHAVENEAKSGEKRPAMYHVIADSYLEFTDKDHARLDAYWITVFADGGPNVPARVEAAGREVDELVRLNGQWLIQIA